MTENTCIVVSGKKFNARCRVVLWNEEAGLSFYPGGPYSKGKYRPRDLSLKKLQDEINSFVVHHSVTYTAHATFRGLIGRGLSVNFIIDDDVNEDGCATIYQCLDVKDIGYSQGTMNEKGSGVEICYHPEYWENHNLYSTANQEKWGVLPHDLVPDKIHGQKFSKVFAPTDAQVKACIHLMYAYCLAFPNVKREFPRDDKGEFIATVAPNMEGFLHHFNITRNKIDAMGFPTDYVEQEVNKMYDNRPRLKHGVFHKLFRFLLKK